jgi:N-methylhydantoinase A
MSDVKHDYLRSRLTPLSRADEAGVNAVFAELETQARADLAREAFAEDAIRVERALDMRYAGQGYEMTIACDGPLAPGGLRAMRAKFDEEHRKSFGHTAPDEAVEIVSWRLRGVGVVPPVREPVYKPTGAPLEKALRERRVARFGGVDVECPVYQRELIDVGAVVAGPALIDQLDCTTVMPPGFVARVDERRNMVITMGAAA